VFKGGKSLIIEYHINWFECFGMQRLCVLCFPLVLEDVIVI